MPTPKHGSTGTVTVTGNDVTVIKIIGWETSDQQTDHDVTGFHDGGYAAFLEGIVSVTGSFTGFLCSTNYTRPTQQATLTLAQYSGGTTSRGRVIFTSVKKSVKCKEPNAIDVTFRYNGKPTNY